MRTTSIELTTLAWPASRLAEATVVLGRRAGLLTERPEPPVWAKNLPPSGAEDGVWQVAVTAARLGLESEPVQAFYPEVEQMVRQVGPAILRLPDESRFLLLLKQTWRGLAIIGPDHTVHHVSPDAVRAALCHPVEAPLWADIDRMLEEAAVAPDRRPKARQAILRQQLRSTHIEGCWLLRLSPGSNLWQQMWHARLLRPLSTLFGAQVIQQLLLVAAWWVLGRSVLQNDFNWAWLWAWGLLLMTIIPFQTLESLAEGLFTTKASALFRQRLLYGLLRLTPEETRKQGMGQFLGRVLEVESLELLALNGGLATLTALISLLTATVVLSLGAGGWFHALLLVGWIIITGLVSWGYFHRHRAWNRNHRQMTNELVERMVGHRTRLAQESPGQWHQEEDLALERYLAKTGRLDGTGLWLSNAIPQGWLVVGLAGLLPLFWINPPSVTALAITIGGLALAFQAFTQLVTGLVSLVEAITAWQQTAPLFQAASRADDTLLPETTPLIDADQERATDQRLVPLLEIDNLIFRYYQRDPALDRCDLQVYAGDRLLLEGPSGGGKSTLAALLAGLRTPESGLLLWQGYDWQTLGREVWRQQVVLAPQFHENHVITGTFAFNLLMGRRWPPTTDDLVEAEAVCRELGLGDLLERMPAGMLQMVGDSGWRLSHGERSRLYIARALLQQSKFIILDESFAALDPENLSLALPCVFKRAPTLLVVAHP